MFDGTFSHYLSYGATDQQTARELAGSYTGLLVPGTVAAFQREGTGGFVLTLSATPQSPEYAIDPRFPLFQQPLERPKKSHLALAALLGRPSLVKTAQPSPADFTDDVVAQIATSWARFNGNYVAAAGSKFDKYARRLGQEVKPPDAQLPTYVLAPYLMAKDPQDPWWSVSRRLFDATRDAVGDDDRCIRVIAAKDATGLGGLVGDVADDRLAVWVSGLEELKSSADDLTAYGRAIAATTAAHRQAFALYGGFFSVLLGAVGLAGASHGIGYGEYRNWIELPDSGPPPPRYYLPQLHRYVPADEATRLFFADRRLAECLCAECQGEPPLNLDYHALMNHSVRCRAGEIESWGALTTVEATDRLQHELGEFRSVLANSGLPDVAVARVERHAAHLPTWASALSQL
jgi:hypothetical protein